jgi:hypothetical protein
MNEIKVSINRNGLLSKKISGDASDFYQFTLVFYTRHQVNITIYRTVYLYTDLCKR